MEEVKTTQNKPQTSQDDMLLWTLADVIKYTGLGENKAREILNRKDSDYTVRVGNKLFVNRKRFEQFLDKVAKYQIQL